MPATLRRQLAAAAVRQGAAEAALELTAGVAATAPVWALDARAGALLLADRPADALALIDRRLERGTATTARFLRARALASLGDQEAAHREMQALTREQPDQVTAWCAAGEIALAAGNLEEAQRSFEAARELSARSSSALAGLAQIRLAQGDPAAGRALLEPLAEGGSPAVLTALIDCLNALSDPAAETHRQTLRDRAEASLGRWQDAVSAALAERTRDPENSPDAGTPSAESEPGELESDELEPATASDAAVEEVSYLDLGAPSVELTRALREVFGYPEFRPGQAAVCQALLDGRDTLAILPTGAGKSLCFQLPSLHLDGVTLVISPLVALMKDQLDGLPPAIAARATLLNSTLDGEEIGRRLRGVAGGAYKLVYVAPERLSQPALLQVLREAGVSRVVVDEAHCVSAWGHDFRPDYLSINRVLDRLGAPPVLALTATAPAAVRDDIARGLGRKLTVLQTPIFRPNLFYEVYWADTSETKLRALLNLCRAESGPGIIYARSRRQTDELAQVLARSGIQAARYHAGLTTEERARVQDGFMSGRTRVIAATVAFGMGINKSDVRFVLHYNLPSSLEAYVQESGRAGRDGQPSRCILLYGSGDKANLTRWLRAERIDLDDVREVYRQLRARLGLDQFGYVDERALTLPGNDEAIGTRIRVAMSLLERAGLLERHEEDARRLALPSPPPDPGRRLEALLAKHARTQEQRVEDIVAYAERAVCRHAAIAAHFDQRIQTPCGACDLCGAAGDRPARSGGSIVSGVRRAMASLLGGSGAGGAKSGDPDKPKTAPAVAILGCLTEAPFPLGKRGLVRALTGSVAAYRDADQNPYFGVLDHLTPHAIEKTIDRLVAAGYLEKFDYRDLPVLTVTAKGRAGAPADWDAAPAAGRGGQADSGAPDPVNPALYERLRAWRTATAHEASVPPYVVFSDAVLRALASLPPGPVSEGRLASVPGIGPAKLERYGADLLRLLDESGAADD